MLTLEEAMCGLSLKPGLLKDSIERREDYGWDFPPFPIFNPCPGKPVDLIYDYEEVHLHFSGTVHCGHPEKSVENRHFIDWDFWTGLKKNQELDEIVRPHPPAERLLVRMSDPDGQRVIGECYSRIYVATANSIPH